MPVILGNASRPSFDAAGAMLRNKEIETQKEIAEENRKAQERIARAQIKAANRRAAMGMAENAIGMLNSNAQADKARQFQAQRDAQIRAENARVAQLNAQTKRSNGIAQLIAEENEKWRRFKDQWRQRGFTFNQMQETDLLEIEEEHSRLAKKYNELVENGDNAAADKVLGKILSTVKGRWIHEPETPVPQVFEKDPVSGRRFTRNPNGSFEWVDGAESGAERIAKTNAEHALKVEKERRENRKDAADHFDRLWKGGADWNTAADTAAGLFGEDPVGGIRKEPGSPGFMFQSPTNATADWNKEKYFLDKQDAIRKEIDEANRQARDEKKPLPHPDPKAAFEELYKPYSKLESEWRAKQPGGQQPPAAQQEPQLGGIPAEVSDAVRYLNDAATYIQRVQTLNPQQAARIRTDMTAAKATVRQYEQQQGLPEGTLVKTRGEQPAAATGQPAAQPPVGQRPPAQQVPTGPFNGKVQGAQTPVPESRPTQPLPQQMPSGRDQTAAARERTINENLPKIGSPTAGPVTDVSSQPKMTPLEEAISRLPVGTDENIEKLSDGDHYRSGGKVYEVAINKDGSRSSYEVPEKDIPEALGVPQSEIVTIYGKSPTGKMPEKAEQSSASAAEKTAEANQQINEAADAGQLPFDVEFKYDALPDGAKKFPAYEWTDKEGKKHVSDNWKGVHNFIDEVSKSMGVGKYSPENQAAQQASKGGEKPSEKPSQSEFKPRPLPADLSTSGAKFFLSPEMQEAHLRTPETPTPEEFSEALKGPDGTGRDPLPGEYQDFIDARAAVRSKLPTSAAQTAPGNLFLDKDGTLKMSDGKRGTPITDDTPLPNDYKQLVPPPTSRPLGERPAAQAPMQRGARQIGPADMARGAAVARDKMAQEAANSPFQKQLDRMGRQQAEDARNFGQPRPFDDPRRKAAEDRLRNEQQNLEDMRKRIEGQRDGIRDRIKQMENNRVFPFPDNVSQNQALPNFQFSTLPQQPQYQDWPRLQPNYDTMPATFPSSYPQYQPSYASQQYEQPLSYYEPQYQQPEFDYMPPTSFQPSFDPVGPSYYNEPASYQWFDPYVGGLNNIYSDGGMFYGGGYNDGLSDYSSYV